MGVRLIPMDVYRFTAISYILSRYVFSEGSTSHCLTIMIRFIYICEEEYYSRPILCFKNYLWLFLLEIFFIFSLAFPILYRLSSLGLLITTPRPTNWVRTGLGDALGLASLRTSRASSGLMCVEVRLKETKTINCGNASTNALLTHAYTMPRFRKDNPLELCTVGTLHSSMLHAAHPATPCEQHA